MRANAKRVGVQAQKANGEGAAFDGKICDKIICFTDESKSFSLVFLCALRYNDSRHIRKKQKGGNMEFLFLGTCACDYSKKLEKEFRDRFDKDARRSSCALLDGKILIDCGEHTLQSLEISATDCQKITDIFITHFHSDHFNRSHIEQLAKIAGGVRLWVQENATLAPIDGVEI